MADDRDGFALNRARTYAGWVAHTALNLTSDVGSLAFWMEKIKHRRPFLTEMEGQLEEAEQAAKSALDRIQTVRKLYKALPAEKK
jgi:hypothetical protein